MTRLWILALLVSQQVHPTELAHSFNSPSFSGIGYSNHVLTLHQLESQAIEKNQSVADAIQQKALSEAANTPSAKFLANLESRIYSQLAKQLTDSMFAEGSTCNTPGVVCGSIPDLGGNSVSWSLGAGTDQGLIIISITNNSNLSQTTTMKVPAGTFAF